MNNIGRYLVVIIDTFSNIVTGIIGFISLIFLIVPKMQTKSEGLFLPILDKLSIDHWMKIFLGVIFFLFIKELLINFHQIRKESQTLPNLKITNSGVKDDHSYLEAFGDTTFLGGYPYPRKKIVYIDFINLPMIKDIYKNKAVGVNVFFEYFNDDMTRRYCSHYGRWLKTPELDIPKNHKVIDIPSNGISYTLGVAYLDREGYLIQLNADEESFNSNQISQTLASLTYGKYVVKTTITGENLPKNNQIVFDLVFERDAFSFKIRKDGLNWVKKADKLAIGCTLYRAHPMRLNK
jgi:hypothetical protein